MHRLWRNADTHTLPLGTNRLTSQWPSPSPQTLACPLHRVLRRIRGTVEHGAWHTEKERIYKWADNGHSIQNCNLDPQSAATCSGNQPLIYDKQIIKPAGYARFAASPNCYPQWQSRRLNNSLCNDQPQMARTWMFDSFPKYVPDSH